MAAINFFGKMARRKLCIFFPLEKMENGDNQGK